MSISRSLNFSIFQNSNSSQKKEDFVEDDEEDEDDYDWGKYFQKFLSVNLNCCWSQTFGNFLADKSCQWKSILNFDWLNTSQVIAELAFDWLMEFKGRKHIQYLIHSIIQFVANKMEKTESSFNIPVSSIQSWKINFKFCCSVSF